MAIWWFDLKPRIWYLYMLRHGWKAQVGDSQMARWDKMKKRRRLLPASAWSGSRNRFYLMGGTQPPQGPKHIWTLLPMPTATSHMLCWQYCTQVNDADKSRCNDIGPQDMGGGTIFQYTRPKCRVASSNFLSAGHILLIEMTRFRSLTEKKSVLYFSKTKR